MNDEIINEVINNYEIKLRRDEPSFELTPFEKNSNERKHDIWI